jgi:hypothetical protein
MTRKEFIELSTGTEHRIAAIETKRSNDRYSHFVGRGARGGPTRFGLGRDVRVLVADRPYYCAHLAAGVGNCDIVEGIPGKATGIDYSAYGFKDRNLVLPDIAGFGIELSL